MRRSGFRLLAASSVLLATLASAATRPHYGGTLHVTLRIAPMALDPADNPGQTESLAFRNLSRLIFDTLVELDDRGTPQPALAVSWRADPNHQRWQLTLRHNVMFRDGVPLTGETAAASLRAANPAWKIFAAGDAVTIQLDSPDPNLPAQLALTRNSIVKREGGKFFGTGPFVITQWLPGKTLTLTARDDYWNGRAFADKAEIEFGKNFREQRIALDLKKANLVEIAPEQARRAVNEDLHIETSAPIELVALVFHRDPQSSDEARLREALVLSIDRSTINNVLLQSAGESSAALLPNWMSGYSFLFPADAHLARARQIRGEIRQTDSWNLGYDSNDPLARVIAERITLNARDAGLAMQLNPAATDVRLVRLPLASLDDHVSLQQMAAALGLNQPKFNGQSEEELYAAENTLLQSHRVIPLLHLRAAFGLSAGVKNWSGDRNGNWNVPELWLGPEKP